MKYLTIPSGRLILIIGIALVVYLTPLGLVLVNAFIGDRPMTIYDAIAVAWSGGAVYTFKVIAKIALL